MSPLAAVAFITGSLPGAPYRVGQAAPGYPVRIPQRRLGTEWRILYRIDESKHAVIVQDIQHRSTAYRRLN
jgi:mRNA interferase RelE/StbE